ncbi:MAG: AMP-binding protein, partial [Clostridiales Family XIII bacterium]|nr:AMP-binding protein [Clostridiales Family XIII bacterium]
MYKDETVLHYLKLRASGSGDAMAAVGAGGMTYAELDDMSDRIAASLLHAGVTAGECVGVGYDHCLEALLSILGILKAGAVYVPLNPEYPASRLEYMMDDAGV